jgi:serine/threonine protein kinase
MMSEKALPPTRLASEALTSDHSELETGTAPPFRAPTPLAPPFDPGPHHGLPQAGEKVGDFDLVRLLGSGSFARVFLAREQSLGRFVALKVSRNRGQEARTLASLEHDHIVRVFSEVVDSAGDLRLLCMQYVPGMTLERLIRELAHAPAHERSGRLILDLIDKEATDFVAPGLGALRDREALADMDLIEASCWMGARLAEALAHAHGLGVLHRDIKPANILVNHYGRPLLADFNIAASQTGDASEQTFGGTIAYMAPEHLDAFNSDDFTPIDAVDVRSDVWSLGTVIYELLTGELPYHLPRGEGKATEVLRRMADQRREPPPRLASYIDAPPALERVLARCLAPRPQDRYQSCAELSADLDSCREFRRVQRDVPPGKALTRFAQRTPFVTGAILLLLPQIIASIVNISYNSVQIVRDLSDAQQAMFLKLIAIYNVIAYPLFLGIFITRVLPVYRAWNALTGGGPSPDAQTIDTARRRALSLPLWGAFVSSTGWMLGGVVFPTVLALGKNLTGWVVFWHFLFSFTISGLIAGTYSVLAIEFVIIRVLYPTLWLDARRLRQVAREELAKAEGLLAVLQFCAVLIPAAGVALMVGVGAELQTDGMFRFLVTTLLILGMMGLGLALWTGNQLRQTVRALTSR